MTPPDLLDASEAGLRPWKGSTETIATAANAAGLRYLAADLQSVGSKAQLLAALATALHLPSYFGSNWDALADCLEDDDWIGPRGDVIVLAHAGAYRKAHAADWATLEEILGEAADYWRERHKPLWVFVG